MECDKCSYQNEDDVSQRSMATCPECERVICVECLTQMAENVDFTIDAQADPDDAQAYFIKSDKAGCYLCPECFEKAESIN